MRLAGTLTFTTTDWETARTVMSSSGTVRAVFDTVTSAASGYEGIPIAGVTVTVNDNDTARGDGGDGRNSEPVPAQPRSSARRVR